MKRLIATWVIPILVCATRIQGQEAIAPLDDARPEWIRAAQDREHHRSVVFSRDFHCERAITEARLQLAADFSSCAVVLNGKTVAVVDDFGPLLNSDVAQHLKLGDNTIQLQAQSSQGPAAVALSLKISENGQLTQHIVTDSSWKAHTADTSAPDNDSSAAVSLGKVDPRFWRSPERSKITAFDDYTQWKLAQSENADSNPPAMFSLPGFEVELIRKAKPDESSWVSMAFDPEGRLTIAREDKGLLRLTLATSDERESIETINDTLLECRGLLYAYGDLYANANNSKGLYRLHDSNDDDQFDNVQLLREFPGGVGHGRNNLAMGPDGLIYSIHGDSVDLPQTDIQDRTSPFRDGVLKKPQSQGHLVRTDKEGRNWELVATGLRNPFGIDFNNDGELFTYDADAEYDMGAPWYRPTRVDQLVSGADFGWRGLTNQWPPYELDHADNALPAATIGKGSPTAVKFGRTSSFPEPWRDALFILDWAYGRIVACHLFPRGAGCVCRSETFLKGRPLNVTDLDFGPDGAMYVITGGRKTESSLYRVRWTGESPATEPASSHQRERDAFSAQQRRLRRQLEQFHRRCDDEGVVDVIWPHLASPDPSIRQAARVALEHQSMDCWQQRALQESQPPTAAVALLALARGVPPAQFPEIISALNRLPFTGLSALDQLTVLQVYSLCLADASQVDANLRQQSQSRLASWLSDECFQRTQRFAPTGAGRSVPAKLSRLVMHLDDSVANTDVVRLLRLSTMQEDRMLYLFLLRNATTGWQREDRELFFETLNDLERTVIGGDGMPSFLKRIREAAVTRLSAAERDRLGDLINRVADTEIPSASVTRPRVRDWAVADMDELLSTAERHDGNAERGRELFAAALCSRCHRMGHRGGVVGPDLTSVSSRFSRRDVLKSILDPSDVVAEKYRNVQVLNKAGKMTVGRIVSSGDYRSPTLKISTDPLDSSKVVEILKADVEIHQESKISPMPTGLLATLTGEEITDLLAFLAATPDDSNR